MRTFLLFTIFSVFFASCGKATKVSAEGKDIVSNDPLQVNENASVSDSGQNMSTTFFTLWKSVKVDKNLNHYKKYQTFNEFTMQGEGVANKSPFVYVKRVKDTITVRSTFELDSTRVYVRVAKNMWYSHMKFKGNSTRILRAGSNSNVPIEYDRYFYNDSIVEFRTEYYGEGVAKDAIIKVGKKAIEITDYYQPSMLVDFRNYIYKLSKDTNVKNIEVHTLSVQKDIYEYTGKYGPFKYTRKAYGLWGIQPGLWDTYLCNDENKVEEPKPDKDGVYDIAEIMPKYPGGNGALMDYITEKVKNANWDRESCAQGRVIVGFVVEVDGSISNVKVLRSVEPSRDKAALQIVKEMPKWIPGKRNGKAVRVRYNVPVTFKQ